MGSKRIGIFGGTFSPFHSGHLNCALTVATQIELEQVFIIPSNLSPGKPSIDGPSATERLEMVQVGIKNYEPLLMSNACEVERGGVSYTIDTINSLTQSMGENDFYLIIGADQFLKFDHWKNFDEIIEKSNLVVISREGFDFPEYESEFPPGLKSHIESYDGKTALLSSGREILFIKINNIHVSGTDVRKKLRFGESLSGQVPDDVVELIRDRGWYEDLQEKIEDYQLFAMEVGKILKFRNAINVVGFDLGEKHYPAEFSIVTSGMSTKQTSSMAEHLMKEVKEKFGVWPHNVDGKSEGRWIVVDYGALMVHIFYDYVRNEYRLEELWRDKKNLVIEGPDLNKNKN